MWVIRHSECGCCKACDETSRLCECACGCMWVHGQTLSIADAAKRVKIGNRERLLRLFKTESVHVCDLTCGGFYRNV